MQAVLLAAGVGRRLQSLAGESPKCLLEIGGKTLLRRHLDNLEACGVQRLVVVVGHLREMIEAELSRYHGPLAIETTLNEEYRKGSILSLRTGLLQANRNQPALVMDADVLYHPAVLRRLVEAPFAAGFLLDPRSEAHGEEMMLGVRDGQVAAIRRRIGSGWDLVGEGVGFCKLPGQDIAPLLQEIDALLAEGRHDGDYELAIDSYLAKRPAGYASVADLPWTEIDFDEDVEHARAVVLPAIQAAGGASAEARV